jgi:membrane fusion protein (multidrug efflux system)
VEERNALVINEAALVPMASDNFVYVLAVDKSKPQSGWIAEKRLITLGARFEGFVEVLSGLEQGDKVVTHGLQKIHPGQVLEILNEELNSPGEKPQPLSQLLDRKKGEHKTK